MIFGFSISELTSTLVLIDLIVAFFAIARGFGRQDYGMIAGGAMCGLIALSSTPGRGEASLVKLLLLVLGAVLGLSSHIIGSMRGILYR